MGEGVRDFFLGIGPIEAVQQALGRGWIPFFDAVSLLGDSWGVVLAVGLAFWLGGRREGLVLAAAVVLQAAVSIFLNQFIELQRPAGPRIWVREEVMLASFPSGHVFTTAVLWGGLAGLKLIPRWLAALLVALEAFGRVYLGMHWVADVLAGAVLGVGLAAAYLALVPRLARWTARRPRWTWDVLAGLVLALVLGLCLRLDTDNHQVWETLGVAAGAAAALPLVLRAVEARGGRRWPAASRVLLGMLGIAALFALTRVTGQDDPAILVGAPLLATAWAIFLAPRLFGPAPRAMQGQDTRGAASE